MRYNILRNAPWFWSIRTAKKDQTEQQRRGNAELVSGLKTKLSALEQELAGYAAYKTKVKYRLIPFLW